MYFLGGISSAGYAATCNVLDMETQVWSTLGDVPFGTYGSGSSCTKGQYIYCAGGYINGVSQSGMFKRYDTVTDTWATLANTPINSYFHPTLCTYGDDRIYFWVGWSSGGSEGCRIGYYYTISTNHWSPSIYTAPDAIYTSYAIEIAPDDIRIFGGIHPDHSNPGQSTDVGVDWNWSYNPLMDSWDSTTYTPVPTPGGFSYRARFGDFIYLISRYGYNAPAIPPQSNGVTEIYQISTDTWVTGLEKPNPASNGVVGVYKGNIFCAGALGNGTPCVEIFSSFQASSRIYAQIIG